MTVKKFVAEVLPHLQRHSATDSGSKRRKRLVLWGFDVWHVFVLILPHAARILSFDALAKRIQHIKSKRFKTQNMAF